MRRNDIGAIAGIAGILIGGIYTNRLLQTSELPPPHEYLPRPAVKKAMADNKYTHLGFPIVDKCPCGKDMRDDDRQELIFNFIESKWYRACRECMNNHATFDAITTPPPRVVPEEEPQLAKVIPINRIR